MDRDLFCLISGVLYFKDDWGVPFEPADGRHPFKSAPDAEEKKIPMLKRSARTRFYESDAFKYAEVACADSELVVALVMPKEILAVPELVKSLNEGEFTQMAMAADWVDELDMRVPPFKVENRLDVKSLLERLGITTWNGLKGMSSGRMEVSEIRQQNYFDFNDKGVEAASVTTSLVKRASMPLNPRKSFLADRPFLWFLYDPGTRTVLFAGWYGG